MVDWTKSMTQSFEYYYVDENTWKDKTRLSSVISSDFQRDLTSETLGSATFNSHEFDGEKYIRTYLIVVQNGIRERICLNTSLVQTPSLSFDGKVFSKNLQAYSPLYELKDGKPPVGYYLKIGSNILESAITLLTENCRAPVVRKTLSKNLLTDFVANSGDDWLTFISDLLGQAEHHIALSPSGEILLEKDVKFSETIPIWEFNDDNSSILLPSITMEYDLCDIPNTVEVIYSDDKNYIYSRVVNDDPDSPTSTVSRGREILARVTQPVIVGNPTQDEVNDYAKRTLEQMSTVTYKLNYSHGYCPVTIGDSIRLNYKKAGLYNIKAKVMSQTYNCGKSMSVSETAAFPVNLWKGTMYHV